MVRVAQQLQSIGEAKRRSTLKMNFKLRGTDAGDLQVCLPEGFWTWAERCSSVTPRLRSRHLHLQAEILHCSMCPTWLWVWFSGAASAPCRLSTAVEGFCTWNMGAALVYVLLLWLECTHATPAVSHGGSIVCVTCCVGDRWLLSSLIGFSKSLGTIETCSSSEQMLAREITKSRAWRREWESFTDLWDLFHTSVRRQEPIGRVWRRSLEGDWIILVCSMWSRATNPALSLPVKPLGNGETLPMGPKGTTCDTWADFFTKVFPKSINSEEHSPWWQHQRWHCFHASSHS